MNHMDKAGVYCIENKVNGKRYYGSTTQSFRTRWTQHKVKLKRGNHYNQHLQASWNKYGGIGFLFKVFLITEPLETIFYEQYTLDSIVKWDYDYNIGRDAIAPMMGRRLTDKTRNKISASHKGKAKSEEHQININLSLKGKALVKEIGNRYGNLIVTGFSHRGLYNRAFWFCQCDCGQETIESGTQLRTGKVTECRMCMSINIGEKNGQTSLSNQQVQFIKYKWLPIVKKHRGNGSSWKKKMTGRKIALLYGVSGSAISAILNGRTWSHI